VDDGRTGFLVPPGDADALRSALLRLLPDANLRREMGRRGRKKVELMCGWERVTELTVSAYRAALDLGDVTEARNAARVSVPDMVPH